AANTDVQSLKNCKTTKKILIGQKTTAGLGAGMDVVLGERAATESKNELKEAIAGADLLFLAAGLGGGSGTAAVSVVGDLAKSLGILTIAVVFLPFSFEGSQRKNIAASGLESLKNKIDTYLAVPNDKLLALAGPNTTVENIFWIGDGILREAVKCVCDLIYLPGVINVDFADLKTILKHAGRAFLGVGQAKGEKRALSAASSALQSPLLDFSLKDADGILLNIAGGDDLSLAEVNSAAGFIKRNARPEARIIFGVSEDDNLGKGDIKVTVIATSKK
ncbi:MAG: cell division protein FtsZ, partial [Patescibacteria group bacterium]|nr:cell division protein FtsZ [Patescibacteria group bacterium]